MIERTTYGLSNEHLFYNSDLVVYCEGKKSGFDTHDEMFWERVFALQGIKCEAKSSGSKTDLLPMALRAIQEGVTNIIFTMDRDYSDYHGYPIQHSKVLYTYGYSWENDILLGIDLEKLFSMFAPIKNGSSLIKEFDEFIDLISDECNAVNVIDIRYINSSTALFNRDKPSSIIISNGSVIKLNKEKIEEAASKISNFIPNISDSSVNHIHWLRSFFGKSAAKIIYNWMVYKSQNLYGKVNIPFDAYLRHCIVNMEFNHINNPRDAYYKEIVEVSQQ